MWSDCSFGSRCNNLFRWWGSWVGHEIRSVANAASTASVQRRASETCFSDTLDQRLGASTGPETAEEHLDDRKQREYSTDTHHAKFAIAQWEDRGRRGGGKGAAQGGREERRRPGQGRSIMAAREAQVSGVVRDGAGGRRGGGPWTL